jgi:hypothetical protein
MSHEQNIFLDRFVLKKRVRNKKKTLMIYRIHHLTLRFYVNALTMVKNSAIYMVGTLFGPKFYVPFEKE